MTPHFLNNLMGPDALIIFLFILIFFGAKRFPPTYEPHRYEEPEPFPRIPLPWIFAFLLFIFAFFWVTLR